MRLQKEYHRLKREPVENIVAEPRPSNILEWHFVISGPTSTPYEGGQYHGVLKFPSDYPYKPPSIMMLTPNGRFETNKRLCLSMSDFHPETWVPAWSVASILNGVLSFMLESTPTVGSIERSSAERRKLAKRSRAFNRKTSIFVELFPELAQPDDDEEEAETEAEMNANAEAEQWRPTLSTVVAASLCIAAAAIAIAQYGSG